VLHTGCVIAALGDGHNIGTYNGALFGDVVLIDVLSRDECSESADKGEVLKPHINKENVLL
jgi:hypothetical protein